MANQRSDYILQQIDLLRQFVKRVVGKRPDPELDEALLLAMHLQEKLFPVPPAQFLRLELAEQSVGHLLDSTLDNDDVVRTLRFAGSLERALDDSDVAGANRSERGAGSCRQCRFAFDRHHAGSQLSEDRRGVPGAAAKIENPPGCRPLQ